ncbi:MAG TPA: DNA primase [Acidimicrobiales bacterium]|nr:DNA primase [Acidimicrobiales bacterium]
MAIPEEDVARVRAATDIVALIGEHAALKRQGTRWVGLCPFHQEKSPSFSVNAEEGLYYCFGCQRSGDAISFVRDVEHVDFVEAVRRLADRCGVTITEDAAVTAERQRRTPLYDAMTKAVDFYHQRLLAAPDGGPARDYLRSRGYDGDVVRAFKLGWAPEGWDALASHLKVSEKVLTDSGLGFVNRRGRRQDAFRGRVIFPIFDPSGKAIALGGRILPSRGDAAGGVPDGPKYKNSQDGPIYSKRRTLYGLNWAKTDVVASGEVIVCEGYTDVIAFFTVGLPRAVATCGTALGEDHFRVLGNFATRVVLAYDADAAGEAGATRVYEWERHHSVDVAVAALPAGSDPGDLARTDPEALRRAVAEAQPFLRFRIERVLQAADLRTNEGRAKAAEAALAVVADHPNGLVRDQYLMVVADRCRLEAATLRGLLDDLVRRAAAGAPTAGPRSRRDASGRRPEMVADSTGSRDVPAPTGARPGHGPHPGHDGESQGPGLEALKLVVHQRESVVDRLDALLFYDSRQRIAFETLIAAGDLHEAIHRVEDDSPEVAVLLRRLAVEEPALGADGVVMQLVRTASRRALADLDAQGRLSPDAFAQVARVTAQVHSDIEELESEDRDGAIKAADRLLAWLVERGEESE